MSNKNKKPNQVIEQKIDNSKLLPSIFQTDPNKKMLGATVDVATSKGQLLSFNETYGLRNTSAGDNTFVVSESDPAREESQTNSAFILQNDSLEYTGKSSFLDIDNYFNIKGLPLKRAGQLDKEPKFLDLPINVTAFTKYEQFYWLPQDLPIITLHFIGDENGDPTFSMSDIIGKPYGKLVDDISGKSLDIVTGLRLIFTGAVDEEYKTIDINSPKIFYVKGIGTSIVFQDITNFNYKIPNNYFTSTSSTEYSGDPEYIVIERFSGNGDPWSIINKWYHISAVRTVAAFLDVSIESLASSTYQAKRPIISFFPLLELHNWPKNQLVETNSLLKGSVSDYVNRSTAITDDYGHTLKNNDNVVFENSAGIYRVSGIGTSASFLKIAESTNGDGSTLVLNSSIPNYKLIYSNDKWKFAQNKIAKNQAPLFEFYNVNGISLSELTGFQFTGATILDFSEGSIYDPVLEKNVSISNIDFDIITESNPRVVNSNQIKFKTDIDTDFTYFDNNNDLQTINGPYSYKAVTKLFSFWKTRVGLDLTQELQTIQYSANTETNWTAEILPIPAGFREIHVFHGSNGLEFYFKIEKIGYIKFSTISGITDRENFIPLISGGKCTIVCHDLPSELSFYSSEMIEGKSVTTAVMLEAPYCINNNIKNGIITVDLSESVLINDTYTGNKFSEDMTSLMWKFNNTYRYATVRPEYKWKFLSSLYLQDKTNPIFHDYDYIVSNTTNYDGSLAYKQTVSSTPSLVLKAQNGDQILVESPIMSPEKKTAPISLTKNPLNESLTSLNYYSVFNHLNSLYFGGAIYAREYVDAMADKYSKVQSVTRLGHGTIVKHNNLLSKIAILATNLPFDFTDVLIKQGKHYDIFYNRLKSDLTKIIQSRDITSLDSITIFNLALENIFLNKTEADTTFWYHSNMIGWGPSKYIFEMSATVPSNLKIAIANPISHRAGKETLLHILNSQGKLLMRGVDYDLISELDDYYTAIRFKGEYVAGTQVTIKQWNNTFASRVPASLAKIGLAPVYLPEIYKDTSYSEDKYFLYRHDGTRYFLVDGVDSDNYPVDQLDQLLFEYEKAVWSSISYDIENNSFVEYLEDQPGGFRGGVNTWNEARDIVNSDILSWVSENSIFIQNNSYVDSDPFTFRYSMGSGETGETVEGSWRAIYKYFYDTDRPHSHPWEMLGYTIKPTWWDTYYSWTDPEKRVALESALRLGNRSMPPAIDPNPYLARVFNLNDVNNLEEFPVDSNGNLIAPANLDWLSIYLSTAEEALSANWVPGDMSPYDLVFLNTQVGVASETKLRFLQSPTRYVTNNWLPGSVVNKNGIKLDRTTNNWTTTNVQSAYHRSTDAFGNVIFTAGIESLLSEFSTLSNIDFYENVVQKFNNISIKKEFLLKGFTNKNNVRIKSTSITNQTQNLFVPEENYQVRTVKHYPHKEIFYSGMRIIWNGTAWSVYGFTNEQPHFNYYPPMTGSASVAIKVEDTVMKEKTTYDTRVVYKLNYGATFETRQDLYDFIIGYGKYLTSQGFRFEEPEGGDIRNWQLNAKQFITWSNSAKSSGNYIDLNPAANELVLFNDNHGQLDNLSGNNLNPGLCVDRFNKPLFSKDLLVIRGDTIKIKTKDTTRSVYGIKLVFSDYESVIHLDDISVFNDVYFLPSQGTTKRSFLVGGKKSGAWNGQYFVHGFMFSGSTIIPNFENFTELGRNLLDIENVILDNEIVDASRAQFGLNRNGELRQLFLTGDVETQFKNAITFEKGTKKVFTSLSPLTHKDSSVTTVPYEEYMVKIGEFGNTKNIEYYEFELHNTDLVYDRQLIKFSPAIYNSDNVTYIGKNSWVYKPYGKNLEFKTISTISKVKTSGPMLPGDTDYAVTNAADIANLYTEFAPLYNINNYDSTKSYKKNDMVRQAGKLYSATTTVPANTWANNSDRFTAIDEPYLPNIFVENYDRPNPDLTGQGKSIFTPATWQVLQTIDREIGIVECCTGLTDSSLARVSTNKPHLLSPGDQILIINAEQGVSSANGIWTVKSLDVDEPAHRFFIDTRIKETIKNGKLFTFKPVRFKNPADLVAATGPNADALGYSWKKKFNPQTNALGTTNLVPPATPSNYPSEHPVAIVDDKLNANTGKATFDYGSWAVYKVDGGVGAPLKEEGPAVDISDIEHFLIYDYTANKTIAKVELFDPKKLAIPKVLLNEIDAINRVDPAKYNRTTDSYKSVYLSSSWYEEFVGYRWWDMSSIQFADYDTGSDNEKSNSWGKTVNGKLPDIYEWTKSPVPPNQWNKLVTSKTKVFGVVASGQAFVDNYSGEENYHWVEEEEFLNGKSYSVYYFWVKNKNSIPKESKLARIYTCNVLSKILLNPDAAGIPWWAPISKDTILVKGIKKYLNESSTVVQIKKKLSAGEKSQQWLFVSENNPVQTIPEWMHIRFRDSLSSTSATSKDFYYTDFDPAKSYKTGDIVKHNEKYYVANYVTQLYRITGPFDSSKWTELQYYTVKDEVTIQLEESRLVPDTMNLHKFNLLGNEVRPYAQSWFSDLPAARREFFTAINKMLKNIDLVSLDGWDKRLGNTAYIAAGTPLNITEHWDYVDYVSNNFNSSKEINYVVLTQQDMYALSSSVGDYIKVLNEGVIYEQVESHGYSVVYRTNGTIQFKKDGIYNDITNTWDSLGWDFLSWDYNILDLSLSVIIDALRYDIFVSSNAVNYGNLMCIMLRYILSEQVNVTWVQKSSTIQPANLIGQNLTKVEELERDNISILSNFYNNVKSFRDKTRDGNISKQSFEDVDIGLTEIQTDLNITIMFDRVNIDTSILALNSIKGIDFPAGKGWGGVWDIDTPTHSNHANWSTSDDIYNSEIEVNYQGTEETIDTNISGLVGTTRYNQSHGDELVNTFIDDCLIVDVKQTNDITIRMYQWRGVIQFFILRNDNVALIEPVDYSSNEIKLTNMESVPDASVDDIQFLWINEEKIGYSIKTETGITGLIRGAHGTSVNHHEVGASVYLENADSILIPGAPLGSVQQTKAFFEDGTAWVSY